MIPKKANVEIYRSWCKRCGICAAFCPFKVIEMDEEGAPRVADLEKCKGCRLCELRCPDFAIRVKTDEVRSRDVPDAADSENSTSSESETEDFSDAQEN
jgi:2-oxoglutarate ferredoxin oxidoreductase subunit delta